MEGDGLDPKLAYLLALIREGNGGGKPATRSELRARFVRLFPATDAEFRIMKEELIEKGFPICSGPDGYRYPTGLDDGEQGARFHERLAMDHHHKAKLIREACLRLFGPQLALPGMGGRQNGKA
jgi:hypothetical protein